MIVAGVKIDTRALEVRLRKLQRESEAQLVAVLHRVGQRTIEILQGYAFDMEARPVKKGRKRLDTRPRHPGGWADKSGKLAESYGYEVVAVRNGVALTILNTDRKATLIEARDGYFVVSGVTEAGGPVDRALREAIAELAPGWEMR